jgi:transposase
MMTEKRFAGIDVAKAWLDVAIGRKVERVDNAAAAIRQLADRLRQAGITAVGLEPTGIYGRLAVAILREAGFEVLQVDSWRLRQFMKSRGTRAKNDRIDARGIALFLEREPARPFPQPGADQVELTAWVREVSRAEADIRRLANRREGLEHAAIAARLDAEIAGLRETAAAAEAAIAAIVARNEELADKARLLDTIPGVGPKTIRVLLAEMPELGTLAPRAAGALAGMAPYQRQSGKRRPLGHTEGGRTALKRATYLAASAALLHNPWAKAVFRRLRANGKPYKVALVAIGRRLVTICNAMIRDRTPWNPAALA